MRTSAKILVFVTLMAMLAMPVMALAGPTDITNLDRTITPNPVGVGQPATVRLSMEGNACQVSTSGADVALVMDNSGSMNDFGKITAAKAAAIGFLQRMDFSVDQGTVVTFNTAAQVRAQLGSSQAQLTSAIQSIVAGGGTAIGEGIRLASQELQSPRQDPNNASAMVVLSDGRDEPANPGSNPVGAAQAACSAGIQVFSIGLGADADQATLGAIPCNGGFYRFAPTPADLDAIYQAIADAVLGPIGTAATITEQVPAGVTVIPGSISDGGVLSGSTITWTLAEIRTGQSVSYQVSAAATGSYMFDAGSIAYTDCAGNPQTMQFPARALDVIMATPSPTPIPEPTTILLLSSGAAGLAAYLRKRRQA